MTAAIATKVATVRKWLLGDAASWLFLEDINASM